VIPPFSFAPPPRIIFGAGSFDRITGLTGSKVRKLLIVTGSESFRSTDRWDRLVREFGRQSVAAFNCVAGREPTPELVDLTVETYRSESIDMVLAIGGGSVIDAGKAISAMLTQSCTVVNFLEGVGTGEVHSGEKVPFIAVPTTAGTGSEATKNAVLSRTGLGGFKKSLRHDNFVPDIAVVDPELMLSCPPGVTAACGMDAFTQLLESYVSTKAAPLTDALAWSGLCHVKESLIEAYRNGGESLEARAGMAYAALMSGITLANAGLGVVHGFASSIGGMFDIPHGVICGSLTAPATRITIGRLKSLGGDGLPALEKYARTGELLSGKKVADPADGCELLLETMMEWTELLQIPSPRELGIPEDSHDAIIAATGNKNNPAALDEDELRKILGS